MTLFLKFRTESGDERRAMIDGEIFFVGRHSECDICIPDSRLSRRHVRLERFEGVYVASDAGSSNGTTLNGQPLLSPTAIKNGDVISLGGYEVMVGAEAEAPKAVPQKPAPPPVAVPSAEIAAPAVPAEPIPDVPAPNFAAPAAPEVAASSNTTLFLILIPVFGLILLLFGSGVVYLLVSQSNSAVVQSTGDPDNDLYGDSLDNDSENDSKNGSSKSNSNSDVTTPPSGNGNTSNTSQSLPPANTANLGETAKIEQNGGTFLRQIAQNNPRAFLTGDQAKQLSGKIKQLSGSSSLAENLKNAQKNSSALKSLAASKNLKPQFLAVAAIAKLGSGRGDVLQTAQGMTEILDKLTTHLGNELADDSLLVIAAYGQGTAGDFMKMRNMLQDLANKSPQSSREIRSIWFLQKNGKISQGEFENALNFLAIGTIAQNPKDFGVNAEALSL
jgi:hypothetical protein